MTRNHLEILRIDKSHLNRLSTPAQAIDELLQLVSSPNNNLYGAGNWLIIPTDELPTDFSVDTYTIEGGALVPASAELITIREAAALVASREAVRVARETRHPHRTPIPRNPHRRMNTLELRTNI